MAGPFQKSGGKRIFPPEWYAAQAARRKKNSDGTQISGTFKVAIGSSKKKDAPKRAMPASWHEAQAKKAADRKKEQEKGSYTRKVRGKISDYREEGISSSLTSTRRVTSDGDYTTAQALITNLRKGALAEISTSSGVKKVKIEGAGFHPMTRRGIDGAGKAYIVDTDNLVAAHI